MKRSKDFKQLQVILAFLVLLLAILSQYYFGSGNHNEQVPIVKRIIDDKYLENDWFVNQNDGFSVRYYYSAFLAKISEWIGMQEAYLLVYLICLALSIFALFLISYILFANKITSFLSTAFIMLGIHSSLGLTWIWDGSLLPLIVSTPFILFALYFFLKEKNYISFLMLGFATLFHILNGLLMAIILLSCLMVKCKSLKNLAVIFKAGVVYLIAGGINIFPIIISNLQSSSNKSEVITALAHMRHPWHYMPFQWSLESYILFFSVCKFHFF